MISSLHQAIEKLYTTFSNATQPTAIEACSCCISDEEINALLSKPLREITNFDLINYTDCAFLTVGDLEDFKYLLPRILEIFACQIEWWGFIRINNEIYKYFTTPEIFFSKFIILAEWEKWPQTEKQAVTEYLDALLDELLQRQENTKEEIDSCLCLISMFIENINPYFNKFLNPRNKQKLVDFYKIHEERLKNGEALDEGWWDYVEDNQQVILDWFSSEQVKNIISSD
jgi:hypothetical protein